MPQFTRRLLRAAAGVVVVISLTGCRSLPPAIAIDPVPQTNLVTVAGAERVRLKVEVEDIRMPVVVGEFANWSASGDTPDNYSVLATNDVAAAFRKSIQDALIDHGFKLSDHGATLLIQLETLYSRGKLIGRWPTLIGYADSRSKLSMSVQIKGPDNTIVYSQSVTAKGISPKFRWDKLQATKDALENALANSIAQLFVDQSFVHALLKAGGSSENSAISATIP